MKSAIKIDGFFINSGRGWSNKRYGEGLALNRIENARKRMDLDLCQKFDLPTGVECGERVKRGTLMFCSGKKENCPLG